MRYHLCLNFVGKMVKIAGTFCLDLAVRRCMSTSVTQVCKNFFNSQNNLNNSLKKASVWPYRNIILTLYYRTVSRTYYS